MRRSVVTFGLATSLAMTIALVGCGRRDEAGQDPGDPSASPTRAAMAWSGWGVAPPETSALTEAALARDPDHPEIAKALAGDPARRHAAVWTALRIGGPGTLDLALEVVGRGDPVELGALATLDPPVSEPGGPHEPSGAWAELEDALWTRYAVTESETQARALLLGIARSGGSASVSRLAVDLARVPERDDVGRYVDAMHALGMLCARGHALDEVARDAVGQGLDATDAEVRGTSAWTLWRCVEPSAEVLSLAAERKVLVERLERMLQATDEEVAAAWRALAALAQTPSLERSPFNDAADGKSQRRPWWVEIEAVRALATTADGRTHLRTVLTSIAHDDLETYYRGPRPHVLLEMIRVLRPHVAGDDELSMSLEVLLSSLRESSGASKRDERVRSLIRCEAEAARATKSGDLGPVEACGLDPELGPNHVAALTVEALLDMGDAMPKEQRVAALVSRASDRRPEVAAPALAALAELDDPQAAEVLSRALERPDPGVLAAATGAIAARAVDASRRDASVVPKLEALIRSDQAPLMEARLAAIEALGALARTANTSVRPANVDANTPNEGHAPTVASPSSRELAALETTIMPLATAPNAAIRRRAREALLGHEALLEAFDRAEQARRPARDPAFGEALDGEAPAARKLRFITDAGEFVVALGGGGAPINEHNLARLAKEGFYEGLQFHRVVPGFVVQGGDPRADGYGGPGFLVPCEYSNTAFDRGVVGIATAGKDTGGSQFFVTQTPQPHLDGRYTVVGRVESGMDVVDALMPYDRIVRVEAVEG